MGAELWVLSPCLVSDRHAEISSASGNAQPKNKP